MLCILRTEDIFYSIQQYTYTLKVSIYSAVESLWWWLGYPHAPHGPSRVNINLRRFQLQETANSPKLCPASRIFWWNEGGLRCLFQKVNCIIGLFRGVGSMAKSFKKGAVPHRTTWWIGLRSGCIYTIYCIYMNTTSSTIEIKTYILRSCNRFDCGCVESSQARYHTSSAMSL